MRTTLKQTILAAALPGTLAFMSTLTRAAEPAHPGLCCRLPWTNCGLTCRGDTSSTWAREGRYLMDQGVWYADAHPARIERTLPFRLSLDETLDCGEDTGTPVSEDYVKKMPCKFTGEVEKVTIDLKPTKLAAAGEQKVKRAHAAIAAAQ